MFNYEEILDDLPMDQIAHEVGEPRAEVENAVRNALPALLMGLGANAQDPAGEASLARALQDHDPALLRGGVNLSQVDTAEGAKISHNIFGRNEEAVVNQLGGLGGGSGLIQKLIPILAPIVMSWLAGKFMGRDERQGQPEATPTGRGGGGLGDILGQVLGGGRGEQAPPPSTPQTDPQFRAPAPTNTPGAPTMPFPDEDENPLPQTQQTNQPSGGGLGGGVLGQILGDLLGGGRR
ncbi:DUF937 domain-containing protein [Tessaracoccus sp. MC1756]|uniref:DUF937 domain-containing protein n=1 Tax=Tessaracoccus sp. MC1756 TaxID=2760311 RepID=UPI001600DE3A|nr:DUF937 domain-containing protein [Tessaracoccus sp. MC1756]MBB1509221.1 DUF937 domain-containing protein [Tessaracoccus sp. MC1756]